MPISKIALTFLRSDHWTAHLGGALSDRVETERFLLSEGTHCGYAADLDISESLSNWEPNASLYLAGHGVVFRGINRLQIPTAIWTDYVDQYSRDSIPGIRLFDQVFVTQENSVEPLKQAGCPNVSWLPFAFDTSISNNPALEKIYDVAFVGSLDLPKTKEERRAILESLEGKYKMNDYRKSVYGAEVNRVYNQAKIVVNIPLSVASGFNMRFFEAMASGALLLTKDLGYRKSDLFQAGEHFVTYSDHADLLDKVDYYLKHDNERNAIAQTGMNEVIVKHTYAHRADEVLQLMGTRSCGDGRSTDRSIENSALEFFYRYDRHSADLLADLARRRSCISWYRCKLSLTALGKLVRRLTY